MIDQRGLLLHEALRQYESMMQYVVASLKAHQQTLRQFSEVNRSLQIELEREGVMELARYA